MAYNAQVNGNINNDGDRAQDRDPADTGAGDTGAADSTAWDRDSERPPEDRVGELATAIQFFTRLRVPVRHHGDLTSALWAAPVVGAGIGAAGALTVTVAAWLGLPGFVSGVAGLAAMALVTGGLHEDGLADTADGLGGADRQARLDAMRDSRIGVYGTLALVFVILMKAGGLGALAFGDPGQGAVLIAAAAMSRATLAVVPWLIKPARQEGLGAGLSAPPGAMVVVGLLLGIMIAGLMVRSAGLGMVFGVAVVALLATLVVTAWARRVLGGFTGDVLGAAQQVSETAVILAVSSFAFGNGL